MSRRQETVSSEQWAVSSKTRTVRSERLLLPTAHCPLPTVFLDFHIANINRPQALHEVSRFLMLKIWIVCLDYQKKLIAGRQREVRSIKHRMIWLRQLVQRQHTQYSRKRSHQNRALKGNRNKRGPTVKRLAADIQGIIDNLHPILHEKSAQPAKYSAQQNDQWQTGAREP